MHTYSGVVSNTYTTQKACVEACVALSTCSAADFNSGRQTGHMCFHHTSTSACLTLRANAAVNHFNTMRCDS